MTFLFPVDSSKFFLEKFTEISYYKLIEKLEIVKDRGEAAQILGGLPSPPSAAKCVRTILRIEH